MEYNEDTVEAIIRLYETGQHSIAQICDAVGIARDTFYNWKKKRKAFANKLARADKKRLENLREMAVTGLAVLLQGKEYEEVTTEYVEGKPAKDGTRKPKIKSQKKVKKFILPNPTSVIFALKNLDSDNFADLIKSENRNVDKDGNDLTPTGPAQIVILQAPVSDDELEIKETEG